MSQTTAPLQIFGEHDEKTVEQMKHAMSYGNVVAGALCADGHFGYSQPIGGVIAYDGQVSPSGVGYDIACGNMAVRTMLTYGDIRDDLSRIADEIFSNIEFGMGRVNLHPAAQEHKLFDDERWEDMWELKSMRDGVARNQLGTVGGGNHYVDVFVEGLGFISEPDGTFDRTRPVISDGCRIWVGVHFGSRGFGHKTATGFLRLNAGMSFFSEKGGERLGEGMMDAPTLLDLDTELGQQYIRAMSLAGDYAYAGRELAVQQVLNILKTSYDYSVHNHHNFAWEEEHGGRSLWVVRKGSTPLWPGQESFIGGSMCDISVIVEGDRHNVPDDDIHYHSRQSLFSTVHGAGRVMGRMEAKGKWHRKTGELIRAGKVSREQFEQSVKTYGIELRGGDIDESPFVYRKLDDVLSHHTSTKVKHFLRPLIVCMAGAETEDKYKD